MKREFLYWLRHDTDMIWKGGMGLMLILLFLCTEILSHNPNRGMTLLIVYGVGCMAIFAGLYFVIVRRVSAVLYELGGMIECLMDGRPEVVFPAAEDTILSRLQSQLMRLYDIMHSYEEREHQMRRQLDENIGDLVHQLNTPVTNIRMYAEFLGRDDLTAKERERFLSCLVEQAHKLSWLGESFSKISRLETGIIRLKPERQKLQPVILRAVGQIMEKAQLRGMEISLKGDVQSEVLADAKWTAEAVFNVLDNAVKYGDEGSTIEIEVTKLTNYTGVAVRNSGMEINQEEYHNLFKRFYRGKGTGETEGSGLGLYIVRKILEDEKGYITAGRKNDGRTEFVLYLYHGSCK
ncbi:MAG: HAMP domain-containing histidine kinase [Lachnospiraceae bacterium]|nr:HAMP domain-containing histidine kinase [Lachnospiraceae bacterium]